MVKSWFLRKRLLKFGNLYKVLVFRQFRCPFLHENTVFAPNPSSNLKIKYWKFQNMWNLKINFRTIFWDILTLIPHNSKSSLPTTGTFRYVESHIHSFKTKSLDDDNGRSNRICYCWKWIGLNDHRLMREDLTICILLILTTIFDMWKSTTLHLKSFNIHNISWMMNPYYFFRNGKVYNNLIC